MTQLEDARAGLDAAEAARSTAGYFLDGLLELGVEYCFCNLGTDHAPLIEELARRRGAGEPVPRTILCPHESVAMHMALGYAAATGRPQAVLVHVDVGTANAAMAAHNLCRARIPVLLIAGKAPFTTRGELVGSRDRHVHFIQEPFDQASLVRPYVKWEYALPSGIVVRDALRRAHELALSDPKGPVYLMLARETLAETWPEETVAAPPAELVAPVPARGADPRDVEEVAERLSRARNPLLVTSYAGRNPLLPPLLDNLARLAGIAVVEANPVHLNVPHDSPCFAGFRAHEHVPGADVGILLDVDVPWIPKETQIAAGSWWAQVDVDPVKHEFPIWGFGAHLRVQADSTRFVEQLLEALRPRTTSTAAERLRRLEEQHLARGAALAAQAREPGEEGAIAVPYLCAELATAIGDDAIVVNEGVRSAGIVSAHVPRTRPGTLLGLGGSGLGFSGGAALGLKLARPERTVVQVCGDGSFYFGNPETVYAVAARYGLPILTVVLDNGGWDAVKDATLAVYPDGEASARGEFEARLGAGVDFAALARSAGAHGELVTDPAEVPRAIADALAAVASGRAAVLHARVTPI
jgi:acetolactate synthase-1/2/3 large subunit